MISDIHYPGVVASKVCVVMTSLAALLADPHLVQCQPTVLLLLRTSSILLYSVPAIMVFLLTAILSLYVTIKVRKVFIAHCTSMLFLVAAGIHQEFCDSSDCLHCTRRLWLQHGHKERQQKILQDSSYNQPRRQVGCQVPSFAQSERNTQVCQGSDQVSTEDEHVGTPSFLDDHPPGCANTLVPRTSSSPPGRGSVASFPLCHQVRGRYAEQLLDSGACLCLSAAGQDIE